MARNKITDLRDHLFAQLERLGDDEAMKNPIARDREILRAKSISDISQQIISSAKVEVDMIKAVGKASPITDFMPFEQKTLDTVKPKEIE